MSYCIEHPLSDFKHEVLTLCPVSPWLLMEAVAVCWYLEHGQVPGGLLSVTCCCDIDLYLKRYSLSICYSVDKGPEGLCQRKRKGLWTRWGLSIVVWHSQEGPMWSEHNPTGCILFRVSVLARSCLMIWYVKHTYVWNRYLNKIQSDNYST